MNSPRSSILKQVSELTNAGHYEEALGVLAASLIYDPGFSGAKVELARTLLFLGQFDRALALLDTIGPSDDSFFDAGATRALALFYKGEWQAAWQAFEIRFALMDKAPSVNRRSETGAVEPLPLWDGQTLPKSLLVLGEQGLGDTLQFSFYAAKLAALGTRVVLAAQPKLFHLLKTLQPAIELVDMGASAQVAGIESWCPLMSLPGKMGLKPPELMTSGRYLHPNPELVGKWGRHIGKKGFKIGMCWQGNPEHTGDVLRSAPLSAFAPLAAFPEVRLISLQKGYGEEQLKSIAFADRIEQLPDDFDSGPDAFADSAAILPHLDLVLTTDTAMAHLAGALDIKTVLMLSYRRSDWRWQFAGEQTVWYPSMQVMRQQKAGDWLGLIGHITNTFQHVNAAKSVKSPRVKPGHDIAK